mgnify:FL=1
MAGSDFLRKNKNQHVIKNVKSKKMEKDIDLAVECVLKWLKSQYPKVKFLHTKTIPLPALLKELKDIFTSYKFAEFGENNFIRPDGGVIYFLDEKNKPKFVLISEVKRQGTNDKRKQGSKIRFVNNATK